MRSSRVVLQIMIRRDPIRQCCQDRSKLWHFSTQRAPADRKSCQWRRNTSLPLQRKFWRSIRSELLRIARNDRCLASSMFLSILVCSSISRSFSEVLHWFILPKHEFLGLNMNFPGLILHLTCSKYCEFNWFNLRNRCTFQKWPCWSINQSGDPGAVTSCRSQSFWSSLHWPH